MRRKPLIWHIYPSYLWLIVLAMAAVALSSSRIARTLYRHRTAQGLESAARLAVAQLGSRPEALSDAAFQELCVTLGRASGYRVTMIRPDGRVAGDSEKDPSTMANHAGREEVRQAFLGGTGQACRHSDTLGEDMVYVAVALGVDGHREGVLRMSLSLSAIRAALRRMWWQIAAAGCAVAALAILASALLVRRIDRPIERMRRSVVAFAEGAPYQRLPMSGISELDILANTMNDMAGQLKERIETITRQYDELTALLACMAESVVAVDSSKRITRMNRSAEALFHIEAGAWAGKGLMEIVRNAELLDLVEKALGGGSPVEGEIFLIDDDAHLQAHGSVLRGKDGRGIGAVVVLNDVTRLRKIEIMRRDFVANVSHELKTPITSILGFTDTLRQGAVDDKEATDRFLGIIDKQAARLHSIVEDLLALSSLEDGVEKGRIGFRVGAVGAVIQSAVQSCREDADRKSMMLESGGGDALRANINPALLEQALVNLIRNAVEYGEPGGGIRVLAEGVGGDVALRVADDGPGIAQKHQARLFERFYRVDKGRSRAVGGTGLGLAIVKHVAVAHGGRVAVESALGRGSTFTIFLPAAP